MDEDPSNEVFVLSLLEGYGANEAEAEAMKTEEVLAWRIRGTSTLPGSIEGNSLRIGPRPDASLGKPCHSP
jgi:hypothetical protein